MPRAYGDGLPDFRYINLIPVADVARKLGLEFAHNGKILCWHLEKHKNRRPSFLRVLESNKVKCDACDGEAMSVLNMVKDYAPFDTLLEAAECVAIDFDVPRIAKGSHLNNPDCQVVPPACEDPIALLVCTGVWSELPTPTQRLIPVLLSLATWTNDHSSGIITLSYRGMMTFSGINNYTSIRQALTELQGMGWLEVLDSPSRGESPIKGTGRYRLTPLSERVRDLANRTAPGFGDAIKAEKADRKRQREERARELAQTTSEWWTRHS
jgi:hypothetical protein